jgi:hypothetical protein
VSPGHRIGRQRESKRGGPSGGLLRPQNSRWRGACSSRVSIALDTATRDRQKVITRCDRLIKSPLPREART